MASTFRATLTLAMQGANAVAKVPLDLEVVTDMGLRPGESVRATIRSTNFVGKVHGSSATPGLLIPADVVQTLGLREGQGLRVTIHGRP